MLKRPQTCEKSCISRPTCQVGPGEAKNGRFGTPPNPFHNSSFHVYKSASGSPGQPRDRFGPFSDPPRQALGASHNGRPGGDTKTGQSSHDNEDDDPDDGDERGVGGIAVYDATIYPPFIIPLWVDHKMHLPPIEHSQIQVSESSICPPVHG